MNDKRAAEILFSRITGISAEKCANAFSENSISAVLDNPFLFEGTAEETNKILDIRELFRAAKTDGLQLESIQICDPMSAIEFFKNEMGDLDHEEVRMLLLNTKKRIIKTVTVSMGGISSTVVEKRTLVREALKYNAAGVMIAHNHPSGDPTPSKDDVETTKSIQKAFELVGIEFVDHIVVGCESGFSLRSEHLMEQKQKYEPELER